MAKFVLGGWLTMWVVLAVKSVGELPECATEAYSWELPFIVFASFGFSALLGAWAQKEQP